MAARPSSSREPSLMSVDSHSRRSSLASNPDVFSDDYALEPVDLNLDLTLLDSADTEEPVATSSITPYPAIPNRLSIHHRPSSTAKRTNANESTTSLREGGSVRTSSTSSRFSRVRAQSPYRGPTAPSHPYAMYPQITRASSIASQSTIRPAERSFVHTGGPEHPYALYSQNTVDDDDDDEDIGTQPIPLGFSALGYGSQRGTSNTDVGDIVLSDGHIEQLPPYTRYADNVVAKGNMNEIDESRTVEMDATTSERASLMRLTPSTSDDSATQREERRTSVVETRQPRWQKTAHKRVCGGIALWLLILISVAVVLAALLGGVVGGVVGRRQGATEAQKYTTPPPPAQTTIWLDADPATTNSSTPTCPTGRYSIPFNRTQEIDFCVQDPTYTVAWGCLDIAYLGMTIGKNPDNSPNVQFDDYSVDPTQFLYGPQPPDFNGTSINLAPHLDRDNTDLGIAMFFYEEFDKLTILPNYAIQPDQKPSVKSRDIFSRGQKWDKTPLLIGDQPWYCFWNSTISEFWIFLEQNPGGNNTNSSSSSSSLSATESPLPPTTTNPPPTTTTSVSQASAYPKDRYDPSHTTWNNFPAVSSNTPRSQHKKRSYVAPYLPEYPRMVKMVEKRRPVNNVQPYCQQMRVLANWDIVPQESGQTIIIDELQWSQDPIMGGYKKRDTTAQLESNCVCEWMSI